MALELAEHTYYSPEVAGYCQTSTAFFVFVSHYPDLSVSAWARNGPGGQEVPANLNQSVILWNNISKY